MKTEGSDDIVFASPIVVAETPKEAVADADVVVISVPTTAHAYVAEIIGNHIRDGQTIILNPGHTGGCLEFRRELVTRNIKTKIDLCETMTLTYITRLSDEGVVQIFRKSNNILYASLPAKPNSKVESLFPCLAQPQRGIYKVQSNYSLPTSRGAQIRILAYEIYDKEKGFSCRVLVSNIREAVIDARPDVRITSSDEI